MRIKCRKCQTILSIDGLQAGSVQECTGCGQKFRVPEAKPATASEAVQPARPAPRRPPEPEAEEVEGVTARRPQRRPREDDVPVVEPDEEAGPRGRDATAAFEPRPYQPDGGVTFHGVPILFGSVFLAALFAGWLAALIGQVFYLIILFPIGIGCLVAGGGFLGVRIGKVRNPIIGGVAGLVGGIVAMVAMHYFTYRHALNDPELPAQARPALSEPVIGFLRFQDATAEVGVQIFSRPSSTS